jgi:hypothetical protein
MKLHKLKYNSKEHAEESLTALEEVDNIYGIIHVGMLVDNPGMYNDEGEVIQEPTFIEGWHVDIAMEGELSETLKKYQIFPKNPVHTVAGYVEPNIKEE